MGINIIGADEIADAVARLCVEANRALPQDIRRRIADMESAEPSDIARGVLGQITENYKLAETLQMPICQDTGMACVFLDIGRDAHIDGDVYDAVNRGVAKGYGEGYLRKSIVKDPLRRVNTGDNTPAALYIDHVAGDAVTVTVAPKGFGSENMSAVKMLRPSDGIEGVIDFVVSTVDAAGPNPCPPIVVGVGIGGNFDKVALLAKRALLRGVDSKNPDPYYAALEDTLLERINKLGIGPQGFGGATTALAVLVESAPTHIAGLPAAVNINCHVTRHMSAVLTGKGGA